MTTVYRADTIGSLLRPPYLKLARERWERGELGSAELLLYVYGTPPESEHAEILDSAV